MFGFGKPKGLMFRLRIYPSFFGDAKATIKGVLKIVKLSGDHQDFMKARLRSDHVTLFVSKSEKAKLEKLSKKLGSFELEHVSHRDRAEGGHDRQMK